MKRLVSKKVSTLNPHSPQTKEGRNQPPHTQRQGASNILLLFCICLSLRIYTLSKPQASLSIYFSIFSGSQPKQTQAGAGAMAVAPTEKPQYGLALIFSMVVSLGLVSFASCIAAEFKRTKREDLKLDGKLCYLPGSPAFGFGIAALICLFVAQIIGNLVVLVFTKFCAGDREKRSSSCRCRKPSIATALLMISWMSFGIAVVIISGATSMNRRQTYGKGWLDGKCYLVKDWTYIGSAGLVVITIASTLASAILTIRKTKVHAQVG